MTTTTIRYTSKINSTADEVKTVAAEQYEQLCKETGSNYEVLSDDKPIKLYFDIDIKEPFDGTDTEHGEGMTSSDQTRVISDMATNIITRYCHEQLLTPYDPVFSIKSANSSKFVDWRSGKEKFAMSLHIIVNNIVAMKSDQNKLIKKINGFALGLHPDLGDYIGEGKKLFDESPYDKNRKLRSLYSSKPNENRPFKIEQGSFEQTCITAFIPEDAFVLTLPDEPIKPTPTTTPTKPFDGVSANKYDRMAFEWGMEEGLLDAASIDYAQWRNVGFILKTEFGNTEGWELFDNFSQLAKKATCSDDRARYDMFSNKEFWDKIQENPTKPIKFASLMKMMKDVDAEKFKDIQKRVKEAKKVEKANKELVDKDVRFAEDDQEARDIICDELKTRLIPHKGQWFLKHNNIWRNDFDFIDNYLLTYIQDSKIYRKIATKNGFEAKPYAQNITCTISIKKGVYAKLKIQDDVADIYHKFHTTTKARLCFKDGILDFKMKHFYRWGDADFPEDYYTTVMINRNFGDYCENPDRNIIGKIKKDIFENLFGKDTTKALNFLSRAIAGHFEDKNFATYLGNRNCGKGVLYDLAKTACGDYVDSFEIQNLMYNRKTDTQDTSKKNYWVLPLQFVRLGVNQETPDPKTGLKVESRPFKKLAGGGDEQTAKLNYDRTDTKFHIDTTFLIMGNNELMFDEEDTKEHQVQFSSVIQFKTQEEIDVMRANGDPELLISAYKVKDASIKDNCKTEEWANAFVYMLYENYVNSAITIEYKQNTDEDDKGSLRRQLFEHCEVTLNANDVVLCDDVYSRLGCSKKKIVNELESIGVKKKKPSKGLYRNKACFSGLQ